MTYTEKRLELKEEYDRFLDTLPTLKEGENKDPITGWWIEKIQQALAEERERMVEKDDLLDDMWGLICNVNGGIVEKERPEWYEAFLRIRAKYFSSQDKPLTGK